MATTDGAPSPLTLSGCDSPGQAGAGRAAPADRDSCGPKLEQGTIHEGAVHYPILARMNDLASTCVETSAPPAYGDLGRPRAPLLEHLGEGWFYVYDDLRVAFLNAAARRDIAARGADPDGFPGEPLWNLLPYPPDWPARVAV